MSIDATIAAVSVIAPEHCETCNGRGKDPESTWDDCPSCYGATKERPFVRLLLEPRSQRGSAGQKALTIVNPPTIEPGKLEPLVGMEIWGDSASVMIGTRRWAKRIGYTQIELLERQATNGAG